MSKAVVLLSGGLDSTVSLALAQQNYSECIGICFDYGQHHRIELLAAHKIADYYQINLHQITIDPHSFPHPPTADESYVPARNTIFLSYATGLAEIYQAEAIYIGVNMNDYTNFPDCRPEYIQAFQNLLNLATQQAVQGQAPRLIAPLLNYSKSQIIQLGHKLEAPLELTWSCYTPYNGQTPCGVCDACLIRQEGFKGAQLNDPAKHA
ncbi:MAG: 7-cyano-7-deazaguanine synthase [Chlamydiota bacterium]